MARDAEGRTRRERRELRQAERAAGGAAAPASRSERARRSSSVEEVTVERGRRAATFVVSVGAAALEITHRQAWELAQSLLEGLRHAHVSRTESEEDEAEGEEDADG